MIAILTPAHPTSAPWLLQTYQSLLQQTLTTWTWILLPNNGATIPTAITADSRVRIFPGPDTNHIGALKHTAASHAKANILVELDADDLLTPNALLTITTAFDDPSIHMVYSNSASFDDAGNSTRYNPAENWRYRDYRHNNHTLTEHIAWPPSPHSFRLIYYAPDHVRAWRTTSYWQVGGHDPNLQTGDDHDLCCRFYLTYGHTGIHHIDECLYLYRLHDKQSFRTYNAQIQQQTLANYLRYSRDLTIRWANDHNLTLLDLGGRFNAWPGFQTVDLHDTDHITDLRQPWPFPNNSAGVIKAHHIAEHLPDPIHFMNEAYRVLAPGGWLFMEVPSTDGPGAFRDPTHRSFWHEQSIWYYTNQQYAQFIQPTYTGRFQNARTVTYHPFGPDIPIVQADLIALKPPYDNRPVGQVLI